MKQIFTFLFIIVFGRSVLAQEAYHSEIGLRSDNDAYLATAQDKYYTNGIYLSFRQALKRRDSLSVKKIWDIELGQAIFNSNSGSVERIEEVDRPITGYLFVKGGFNWLYRNESSIKISLSAGFIGADALGKDVQTMIHRTFGFYKVEGWEYALKNSFEVNTSAAYGGLIIRPEADMDLSYQLSGLLGTTFTGLRANTTLRLGRIEKLYRSSLTNSIVDNAPGTKAVREFYFYLRPNIAYVVYDGTIQGGLFLSDKGPATATPRHLVFQQDLGVKYARSRWTFDFTLSFRTKETTIQREAHQYGSISLFYRLGKD